MTTEDKPLNFGFLLVPQFSMLSLAGVLEPLRMANRLSASPLYRWLLFTPDDAPVAASNGIAFAPTAPFHGHEPLDTLIVVAGIDAGRYCTAEVIGWLRGLARQGTNLGATSVGPLFLARAGLLRNHRCTIHWENTAGLREEFPYLEVTGQLYEIDGKRLTCSGGTAGLDMMMNLIGQRHGHRLAAAVAEQCIHPEMRKSRARQRLEPGSRLNITNRHLLAAIEYMELHLEDTLSCRQLAAQIGLSERHLRRLFALHLAVTPTDFYLRLRLERARALLEQTDMHVTDVGLACGFASASHFIRCFHARCGLTPVGARRAARQRHAPPIEDLVQP